MGNDEIISNIILELRRGTLIILVLSQLKKPMYGYDLVRKMQNSGIQIEANTLYPLMRRLESQGLLQSSWNTEEAKPRKYYEISQEGLIVLEKTTEHWEEFSSIASKLIKGDNNEQQ